MAKAKAKSRKKSQQKKHTPRRSARNQPSSPTPKDTPLTQNEQQPPSTSDNIQDNELSTHSKASVQAPNQPVDLIDTLDKDSTAQDTTKDVVELKTPEVVEIMHTTTEVSVIDKPFDTIHLDMNDNDDPAPLTNPPEI